MPASEPSSPPLRPVRRPSSRWGRLLPLFVVWGLGGGFGQSPEAAPLLFAVSPANTLITIRVRLLGVIPLEGHFTRFAGRLLLDPDRPGFCEVQVHIDTRSFVMRTKAAETVATGPAFLDAGRWPAMEFSGSCREVTGPRGLIAGELHLRDREDPFIFSLSREGGEFAITGTLERERWGMTGHPLLTSGLVHIEVRTRILTADARP